MEHTQEIQLKIRGITEKESDHEDSRDDGPKGATRWSRRGSVWWWMLVVADMLMVLCGQTVATLLGRLYFNSGGNSKWLAALTQSGGAPLLVIPLLLTPPPSAEEHQPGAFKMAAIYAVLGIMIGFDNLMYSYAMMYLPVSTFSLVAATQLAFNAVTSRLINAQRFTVLIANSVVVLTFSAALLGVGSSSDETASNVPRGKYPVGFVLTLAASAVFSLVLSLFEVTFEKVIRSHAMRWVLRMQIYTNLAASAVTVVGMFASGDWRTIPAEMASFKNGRARYVMTLVGTAVSWQAAAVGMVRLLSRVSSLFANVTGTVALPLVPVFAVVLFGDRMTGIKVVAMLMALWGFLSYVYQHYLDSRRAAAGGKGAECRICAGRTGSDTVSPA